MEWKDYEYEGHGQESDHPVVNASWEDAVAFAKWLTERDRNLGRIGDGDEYRLPTDVEWSYAVGIGDREDASASPEDKDGEIEGVYPWGTTWPPPANSGNYSSDEAKAAFEFTGIEGGYKDGHGFTAPVGSYSANRLGIHDLGGNVWEWCSDWYSDEQKYRVLRCGSWNDNAEIFLRSSDRYRDLPTARNYSYGFRLVVSGGAGG